MIAAFLLILILAAALAWRQEVSLDLGFHLASGRWILEHGSWPETDPFTYTVADHPYIDMHGLFQVLLAMVERAWGLTGIGLLRLALVLGATGFVLATARRRGVCSPSLLLGGLALGLMAWEMRFFARPELVTYLFLAVELYLLRRHAEDGRPGWLCALPPVQLLWTYGHALSLFGPAVLALYALAGLLGERRRDRRPWIALGLSLLALCMNPYGLRGVAFMLHLGTRMESENLFAGTISELASPFAASVHQLSPILAFKLLLPLTLIAALARVRRPRPFELGLVVVFAILAGLAVRNISLFVVATLPLTLETGQAFLDRLRQRPLLPPRLMRPASVGASALTVVLVLVLLARVMSSAHYTDERRPTAFGRGLSAAVYPLGTVSYLVEKGVSGPLYNHLNFGGYLIGRLWPEEKVFIDGRLEVMGEEFYQESLRINAGPGWPAMMERVDPKAALVPHTFLNLVQRLDRDPEWALVELDGVAALFLRVTPEHAPLLAEARRAWAERRREALESAPPLKPRRGLPWTVRWLGRRSFPWEAYGRGNALYGLGLFAEARAEFLRGLREAGRDFAPLAGNLAAACFRLGRREESLTWYRRVLELDPDYPKARERLSLLARESENQGQDAQFTFVMSILSPELPGKGMLRRRSSGASLPPDPSPGLRDRN